MNTLLAHAGEQHDAVAGVAGHHYGTHEWIELAVTLIAFVIVMGYIARERFRRSKTPAKAGRAPRSK